MKTSIIFYVLLSHFTVIGCPRVPHKGQLTAQSAATRDDKNRFWRPATYRRLTIGKSKVSDMLRIFGKPQSSEVFNQGRTGSETWYHYEGNWEFTGRLTFVVDNATNTIRSVEMYPKTLRKEDAIKYFGADYSITRYDFDLCLGDEESAPLFESPNGSVTFIEYRQRGIAIAVNYLGNVNEISYVSRPIGAAASKCK